MNDMMADTTDMSKAYLIGQIATALLKVGPAEASLQVQGAWPHVKASRIATPVSLSRQLNVFHRDSYHCRYCGTATVFVGLLRVLSEAMPAEFPYQSNWKWNETHPAFWEIAASCDHLMPDTRGGSSEEDNLVTTCYRCNSMKGSWLVEEIGWKLLPSSEDRWDGLERTFLELSTTFGTHNRSIKLWRQALIQSIGRAAK